jgi:hypothetical protein
MIALVLVFCSNLTRVNTWCLAPDGGGIRARLQLASEPAQVIDAQLRFKRARRAGLVYVRRIDEATWVTESSKFDGQLGVPVSLQLNQASTHASASLALL